MAEPCPPDSESVPALILASASPQRAELLRSAGYAITVMPCPHEEPNVRPPGCTPVEWAEMLSAFKARGVAASLRAGLVIGADTIAARHDTVFGKPRDRADAWRILSSLIGTCHEVVTGLTLIDAATGRTTTGHDVTGIYMREISEGELARYLDTGQWVGKAGAYGIQDCADDFVQRIEGSFSNVVGFPLELFAEMLATFRTSAV